jgi:hypothetical protein
VRAVTIRDGRLVAERPDPEPGQGELLVRAATFPLDHAQEAYDRFAAGGKLGKLVLTI